MSFQRLGNLEKNTRKRKLSILCPFNKNCDVTSTYSIFFKIKCHSGVTGQNQVKLGTVMKQDERNSKISNILLPWRHSRFESSLIRNTIISFSTPQWVHNGVSLAFGMHWDS